MSRTTAIIGVVLFGLGVAGYAIGTAIAYPGRAFSITAVMIGVTLLSLEGLRPEARP